MSGPPWAFLNLSIGLQYLTGWVDITYTLTFILFIYVFLITCLFKNVSMPAGFTGFECQWDRESIILLLSLSNKKTLRFRSVFSLCPSEVVKIIYKK